MTLARWRDADDMLKDYEMHETHELDNLRAFEHMMRETWHSGDGSNAGDPALYPRRAAERMRQQLRSGHSGELDALAEEIGKNPALAKLFFGGESGE